MYYSSTCAFILQMYCTSSDCVYCPSTYVVQKSITVLSCSSSCSATMSVALMGFFCKSRKLKRGRLPRHATSVIWFSANHNTSKRSKEPLPNIDTFVSSLRPTFNSSKPMKVPRPLVVDILLSLTFNFFKLTSISNVERSES